MCIHLARGSEQHLGREAQAVKDSRQLGAVVSKRISMLIRNLCWIPASINNLLQQLKITDYNNWSTKPLLASSSYLQLYLVVVSMKPLLDSSSYRQLYWVPVPLKPLLDSSSYKQLYQVPVPKNSKGVEVSNSPGPANFKMGWSIQSPVDLKKISNPKQVSKCVRVSSPPWISKWVGVSNTPNSQNGLEYPIHKNSKWVWVSHDSHP